MAGAPPGAEEGEADPPSPTLPAVSPRADSPGECPAGVGPVPVAAGVPAVPGVPPRTAGRGPAVPGVLPGTAGGVRLPRQKGWRGTKTGCYPVLNHAGIHLGNPVTPAPADGFTECSRA